MAWGWLRKEQKKKTTLKEQYPQKIPEMLSSAHSHTKQKIRYFREHCGPNNIRPHWLLLHGKTYLLLCNTGKKPVQICNDIERKCIDVCTFTFNHLADAFIQSDVQMRRTIEAIRPSREQQYTSAMTSLS